MSSLAQIQATLKRVGQNHLLKHWNELDEKEQQDYLQQFKKVDLENSTKLFKRAMSSLSEHPDVLDRRMKPIPESKFQSEESCPNDVLEKYRILGLENISKSRVAVLVMAGGQGTRLGFDYPKGMYSVNLPSGKTLFQIQAERIRRLQTLAKEETGRSGRIPWYIMTSGPTHKATKKFLEANSYFGLQEEDVVLFRQGLLPCFDLSGKIILESKNSMALAPDGNGGIYRALAQEEVLKDMEDRGVDWVHVHSVDNVLVKVADPVFVGYCASKRADCGAKVVRKSHPTEAVGVVCQVDGRFQVVEYSEIGEAVARKTDERGELVFNSGNICNHLFTVDFLHRIAGEYEGELKLHVAKKKIPCADEGGSTVRPQEVNGIKIEKFIFDVFQFSDNFVTWEVPRGSEFSALKNADAAGKDCPSTARSDLLALHRMYIERAGGAFVDGKRDVEVEISPLVSYGGENLEAKVKGKVFDETTVLDVDGECKLNGSINSV